MQHFPDLEHAGDRWRVAHPRDRHGHQNSHTFYLRYQGPLPAANDVKVDITINEVLCFPLQDRPIQRAYDSFDDLPEGPTVKVYAVEEIVVEKLPALSDRARNEPRDLYDLWYLFGATDLRIVELRAELDAKLTLRQRVVAGMEQVIATKEDRLRRLWAARLAHQMSHLPSFDDVFREVLRAVRAAAVEKNRRQRARQKLGHCGGLRGEKLFLPTNCRPFRSTLHDGG